MLFGQNVLRMTWKERFVQFSWKAHCFPVLKRISGQCDYLENFDAQKWDLAKTSYAWSEKRVLYNYHEKRTVFPFCRGFETSVTILRSLTLKNAILPKTCCSWPEKSVLYSFHWKRTVFPLWREFQDTVTILTTLTLKNAIWPKRAAHDLKRAFCTIFMKIAPFSLFGGNFRPVWRFWQLWHWKMRFGQNLFLMTWKERFVQFSWKAHCFPVLKRISGQCDDFWELWRSKMRFGQNVLRMTCEERFVKFSWKAHCFPVLKRILGQCDDLENFDTDLKRAVCRILIKSAQFSFLERIWGQCDEIDNFNA